MFSTTVNTDDTVRAGSPQSWLKLQPIIEVEEPDGISQSSSRNLSAKNALDVQSVTSSDTYRTANWNFPRIYGAFDLSSVSSVDRLSFRTADEGDPADWDEIWNEAEGRAPTANGSVKIRRNGYANSVMQDGKKRSNVSSTRRNCESLTDRIFTTDFSKAKFALVAVAIIAFLLLFWGIIELIYDYREGPFVTTQESVTNPELLQFPVLYICPSRPVHNQRRKQAKVSIEWEKDNAVSECFKPDHGPLAQEAWREETENTNSSENCNSVSTPEYTPEDIQDYFMKVGYSTETLFMKCKFGEKLANCSEAVESIFDPNHGKCFLLRNLKLSRRFPAQRLSLVLNIDSQNAFIAEDHALFRGVLLRIGHVFDVSKTKTIMLEPGKHTVINLEATRYSTLPAGRQKCVAKHEKPLKLLNADYSVGTCRLDCLYSEILEKSGCVPAIDQRILKREVFATPVSRNITYCSCNQTKIYEDSNNLALTEEYKRRLKDCYKQCVHLCEYWNYRSEINFASFAPLGASFRAVTNSQYNNVGCGNRSDDGDWSNYISLEVSFSLLQYLSISQEPVFTFVRLLADIGGLIFLWLFISALSAVIICIILNQFASSNCTN